MKLLSLFKVFASTLFLFLIFLIGAFVYLSGRQDIYGWRILVVKSGSMEPVIQTGSLIFIRKQSEYKEGDVVTYGIAKKPETLVTHRIVAIEEANGSKVIQTKGDFNQIVDKDKSPYSSIIGTHQFGIPYLGYLIGFAKTPPGVILLVVIPGTLIIYDEIRNIKKHAKKMIQDRKSKKIEHSEPAQA
jgi:signal peptidase I